MVDLLKFFNEYENKKLNDFKITEDELEFEFKKRDCDINGMLFEFLTNKKYLQYIEEPLLNKFSNKFLPIYFIDCIEKNPSSDWSDSRFSAAWNAVGWFYKVHNNTKHHEMILYDFIEKIGVLFLEGNAKIREAIIVGFLEHVLNKKAMWKYFKQWKKSPELYQAYIYGINKKYTRTHNESRTAKIT